MDKADYIIFPVGERPDRLKECFDKVQSKKCAGIIQSRFLFPLAKEVLYSPPSPHSGLKKTYAKRTRSRLRMMETPCCNQSLTWKKYILVEWFRNAALQVTRTVDVSPRTHATHKTFKRGCTKSFSSHDWLTKFALKNVLRSALRLSFWSFYYLYPSRGSRQAILGLWVHSCRVNSQTA